MRNLCLMTFLTLMSWPLLATSNQSGPQSGTSAVDEKYLKEEAVENKLENEAQHQRMEERQNKDIESFKYDPWGETNIKSPDGKVDNRDPRD